MHDTSVHKEKEIVALRQHLTHLTTQHGETDRLNQLTIQVLQKELATWQAKCDLRDAQIEVLKNQQKRITPMHPDHISPRLVNFYLSPQMPQQQQVHSPRIEVKYEPQSAVPFVTATTIPSLPLAPTKNRTSTKHARDDDDTPKPSRKKSRLYSDPGVLTHHTRPHRTSVFRSRGNPGSQKQRVLRALRSLPEMAGTSNMIQKLCPELSVAAVSTCLSKMRINGQVTGEMQENTRKRIWKLKPVNVSREGSATVRTPTPPAHHSNAGQTPFHSPQPAQILGPPQLEAVPNVTEPTDSRTESPPTGLRDRKVSTPLPTQHHNFIQKTLPEHDLSKFSQQQILTPMPISNRRTPSPQEKTPPKYADGPVSQRPSRSHIHHQQGSGCSSEENFQP